MDHTAKINKQLRKQFGGRYTVRPEREHLVLEGESGDWQEIVAAGHLAAKGNRSRGKDRGLQRRGRGRHADAGPGGPHVGLRRADPREEGLGARKIWLVG